ncbi:MAG: hypothetical protein ACE5PT_05170 [Gemmatimonadales bacterium]
MSIKRHLMSVVGIIVAAGIGTSPLSAQEVAKPPVVSHDTEGRGQCLMCHKAGVMEPVPDVPESHAERPNDVCLWCHAKDAPIQTADPPPVSHETQGREQCLMCHKAGVMEPVPDVPASHEGIGQEYCGLCHKKAG